MHSMEKVGSGRSHLTRAHSAPKREPPSPQQPPGKRKPVCRRKGRNPGVCQAVPCRPREGMPGGSGIRDGKSPHKGQPTLGEGMQILCA